MALATQMLRATAGNMLRELDNGQETNGAALQGLDTTRGCSREGKTDGVHRWVLRQIQMSREWVPSCASHPALKT